MAQGKGLWAANESSPGGKGEQRALDGWGRVVLVVDFARAAKGLVNLIKGSRVYLEGDCKVPEVFKAGVTRSDLQVRRTTLVSEQRLDWERALEEAGSHGIDQD